MYEINQNAIIYSMDKAHPPVLTVPSGAIVKFCTNDALNGQLTADNRNFENFDWSDVNPATGPLAIEGAKVGDVLRVEIQKIDLADTATLISGKVLGVIAEQFEKIESLIMPVRNGFVELTDTLKIPVRPMIGVIGTAPAKAAVNNGTPGEHGGNMDCKEITEGVVLYLPVNVEGALLSMGDLHAAMADGEVCGCGAEVSGAVTVKVDVLEDCHFPTPCIESEETFMPIASAETMDEAIKHVVNKGVSLLQTHYGLPLLEAIAFMSMAADVKICQVVDPLMTARVEIPKKYLTV